MFRPLLCLFAGAVLTADAEDPIAMPVWTPPPMPTLWPMPPMPTMPPMPPMPQTPVWTLPGMPGQDSASAQSEDAKSEHHKHNGKKLGHEAAHHSKGKDERHEASKLRKHHKKATRTEKATTTKTETATTTSVTTTTITTTTNTCSSQCVVNDVAATCTDHIQQTSLVDYLGDLHSCDKAQKVIAEQCPVCGGCPAHEAGCDVLELPPTPPPTTIMPAGQSCEAVCVLGGQPATCSSRIAWSVDNVFGKKPGSCQQAHDMVLDQCSICGGCNLVDTTCVDPSMFSPDQFNMEVFKQQKFDDTVSLRLGRSQSSSPGALRRVFLLVAGVGLFAFVTLMAIRRASRHDEYVLGVSAPSSAALTVSAE
mmetsp:Transcript_53502/g.153568  ORF Transcript_53502/g.153568 Transcript_53502/m.153568 type:complete len:365 (-) Transcript_53502:249-1343(-)